MEKLIHIQEASELLGISQEELNILIESKKIDFVVSSMTKKIKQSTIDEIIKVRDYKNLLMLPLEDENIWKCDKINLNNVEL